ncbi:hypothetical protein CXQ85_001885 [Candidozyma haemuli]|uniref:Uncharacterized protein n=1 Tax=Candidozyma haemuli TaxID=45357 RepID=A0A2V1AQN1_9ASCO|nr:hypothetical protein CXQ85_001885 [[Candida] haemuloni]PVH20105.1 hypothetical protein CXQ85_001885 [[Candida] haemuloni]
MLVTRCERTVSHILSNNGSRSLGAMAALNSSAFRHAAVGPWRTRPLPWAMVGNRFRYMSTDSKPEEHSGSEIKQPKPIFDPETLYIVSIPITTHRSYIFCNHKSSFLDKGQKVPLYVRAEAKIIALARKGWDKLRSSEITINKKVVVFANKLLDTIPYDESCLQSFPAKKVMVREINEEHLQEVPKTLVTGKMKEKKVSVDQLKPIPVYHPRFQEASAILSQMHHFRDQFGTYHRKWAIWCGIGVPITLPLALIPVMPNVPGFYLAYRFYCHIKALMGVNNMGYLLETTGDPDADPTPDDTTHLTFQACSKLDVPYLADATFAKVKAEDNNENESVLVTHDTIDRIVDHSGLEQLRDDLHKALKQESARLKKQLAEESVQ